MARRAISWNLARELDSRIEGLRTKFGEIGDTRLTVMAALTVADELAEMAERIKHLEQEFAALQDVRVAAADREKTTQSASRPPSPPLPNASRYHQEAQ